MGEIKFTNGLVMAALFAIAIIIFAGAFASDNESSIYIGQDSEFQQTQDSLTENLSDFGSAVGSASDDFNKDNVQEATDTATSGGQFKVTGSSVIGNAKTILNLGFKKIFGENSGFGIFFSALIAVLVLMAVRYFYKTWFGKDPD